MSFYLLGNFVPFFEGSNDYFYALVSINFSNGVFSITNELLQETGKSEFVGSDWLKTNYNSAIPRSGMGFSAIGSVFYLIGGYYGLFYMVPIFTILLLIFSERIATNLFGKYVGLLTLLFLATSNLLFRHSIVFKTESVFTVFFILGVFFLIKYLKQKRDYHILIASILLAGSTFIRINGIINFPAELIIVIGFFIIQTIRQEKRNLIGNKKTKNNYTKFIFSKLMKKKTFKISLYIFIPWIVFIATHAMILDYYIGSASENYLSATGQSVWYDTSPSALIKLEKQDFENLKAYSRYLLPYQFPALYDKMDQNFDDVLGDNWPGVILLLVLFITLIVSLYTKNKRLEIIAFLILITSTLWLYSASTTEARAMHGSGIAPRFMLPIFPISSMLISYLIMKILMFDFANKIKSTQIVTNVLKVTLVTILIVFFIGAFYFSPSVQIILDEGLKFNNPQESADRYPLDLEGLTEKSVIVSNHQNWILEYGAIPFNLIIGEPGPNMGKVSPDSVKTLKQIIGDGYDVYVLKNPSLTREKNTLNELVNNYGIILKDHSKSFCKIELDDYNGIEKISKICIKWLE